MTSPESTSLLTETLAAARRELLASATERGSFCGQLSSSALSTATASVAFTLAGRAARGRGRPQARFDDFGRAARAWLRRHQNDDGSWGDTTDSPGNISTTVLAWAALELVGDAEPVEDDGAVVARAETWIAASAGGLEPERLATTIRARYGRDKTFSVPILLTCAIAGRLGKGRDAWRFVPSLPFELAACPHQWFQWLKMPMVSYALPALIAIGQARHHHRPGLNPITRVLRRLTKARSLRILRRIQPTSGGYLEAAPLTSFVAMSLVSVGKDDHPVVEHALRFLAETVRPDGCWPIDTNLDTWLTTSSVTALCEPGSPFGGGEELKEKTRDWLLAQQYLEEHPYTHAPPGGWAWTDLSGGVPDADDSAGALMALHQLSEDRSGVARDSVSAAASRGIVWLLGIQNRDGGIPTFCRGWGHLPFDRSSPDLTAHALCAFAAWRKELDRALEKRVDRAQAAAVDYLLRTQRRDGAWVPLWFGNQEEAEQENPIYGTSRVLRAIHFVSVDGSAGRDWSAAGGRAVDFVLGAQAPDGGFGGAPGLAPTVEETAFAVEALADHHRLYARGELRLPLERGVAWLIEATEQGRRFMAAPIGLYFAKLWYSERLYPLIFAVSALGRARRALELQPESKPQGESDPCLEKS